MKLVTGRYAQRRAIGLLLPLALGILAAWAHPRFDSLERLTWDLRFVHRGVASVPDNVVVVEINEDTVAYPPWIGEPMVMWGRHYANAVRNLSAAGAEVIGFDLLPRVSTQDLADQLKQATPWDEEFARALAETQKTVLVKIRERQGWALPTDQLLYANGEENTGAANFLSGRAADPDTVVRAFQPSWEGSEHVPSFAVRLVEKCLGQQARYSSPQQIEIGDIRIPLHRDGTLLINYAGPPHTLPCIAFHDVAEGRMPRGVDLHGKVALIGASYAGLQDLHLTPFTRGAEADRQHMPGVEVWANAVSTILNGRFLSTTGVPAGRVLLLALSLLIGALFLHTSLGVGAAVCILSMLAWYSTSCWLFAQHSYLLLTFVPMCLMPANYSLVTAYRFFTEEREKRQIKGMWSRYLNVALVDHLLEHPEEQGLGGKRATVTVLFSDVRGFTALSDHMAPADVVRVLNEYFSAMSTIVAAHGGIVDKYVGDAIMAVWGVPVPCPDGPERAVQTAIEMQDALEALNQRWERDHLAVREEAGAEDGDARKGTRAERPVRFAIGIGINTGEAVFGNIGSDLKMDMTVIGDTVNVASRLEGLTKEYAERIIIGEGTWQAVEGIFPTRPLPPAAVRGKESRLPVYAVDVRAPEGSQKAAPPGAEGVPA